MSRINKSQQSKGFKPEPEPEYQSAVDAMAQITPDDYAGLYELMLEQYHKDLISRSGFCIDFGEANQLWQNLDDNTECPENVLGWLYALSTMQAEVSSKQARWEMVSLCKETQFASQLANDISDTSAQIRSLADHLVTLHCHYRAILLGRKALDINYTDSDGSWVPLQDVTDANDTSASRKFDIERRQAETEIRRRDPLEYMAFTDNAAEFLEVLFKEPALHPQSQQQ